MRSLVPLSWPARPPGERRGPGRSVFAWAYLVCFVGTELVYTGLNPHAQARLIEWASTDVANLAREPAGPLVLSALVTPGTSWSGRC